MSDGEASWWKKLLGFASGGVGVDDVGMGSGLRSRPGFADLLALTSQGRVDAASTRRSLHRRDRELALGWGQDGGTATGRGLRWLGEVAGGEAQRRFRGGWRGTVWVCLLLAAGLGVLGALALFGYDGSRPVNVLWVLVVFVGLPLVTAGVSAVGMLTGLPGAGWTPGGSVAMAVWRAWMRRGGAGLSDGAEASLRRGAKVLGSAATASAWLLGQWMGLVFVLAGWLAFLVLLATSDLAFGWASTVGWEPSVVAGWLSMAFWFWPELAPGEAMLSATVAERATPFAERYAADAAAFKAWWRPLVVLILVYGVLPRLVLTGLAWGLQRRAVCRAFDRHPVLGEVDARLTTPFMETVEPAADRDAAGGGAASSEAAALPVHAEVQAEGSAGGVWVRWAAAPLPSGVAEDETLLAGGGASLAEDERALSVAAEVADGVGITVAVKAWEPPLAEFVDWVVALRERVGDGRRIEVVAMTRGVEDGGAAAVWAKRLGRLGDPWLSVSSGVATGFGLAVEEGGAA